MRRSPAVLALLLAACPAPAYRAAQPAAWVEDTRTLGPGTPATPDAAAPSPIAEAYAGVASQILAAGRADRGAYAKLAYLADRIGHRLSGSAALDRAIAWASKAMADDGHPVRTERVIVPHWVRGAEAAAIVAPIEHALPLLALGGSVATPKAGLVAPVVVVRSWDELARKATQVAGAIVLYDVALPAYSEAHGSGYGEVAAYRSRGPSRAAAHGAVAVLVRSVTARSLRTPHTGALRYDPAHPKIPAAAITTEDADLIARLAAQGPVRVRLRLASQQLPDAPSANVIGELRGRERPEEIVVLGAHLDSWDVGQGAHDDGAGCVMAMQAITLLRTLGLQPRRTIRVVLFTNEENGLAGAKAYARAHAAELANTVLAVEADMGGFAPRGFTVEATPDVAARVVGRLAEIATLMRPLGVTTIVAGHSGADLAPMIPAGVVGAGLLVDARSYFDIHHTAADTLDKVDPAALADGATALAILAYVVADLPARIDAP